MNDQRDSVKVLGSELAHKLEQILSPAFSMTTGVGILLAKGMPDAAYNSTFLTNEVGFLVNQVISVVPTLPDVFLPILRRQIKEPHFTFLEF